MATAASEAASSALHSLDQIAPGVWASGQLLAESGGVGEVGRQLLADAQGRVEVRFRLLEFAEPVPHPANADASLGPRRPAVGVVPLDRGERIELGDD